MNKERRKTIGAIRNKLGALLSELENQRDEEQASFDAIPENLAGSQRYENAEQAVTDLEDACESLQEVIDYIDNAAK